MKAFFAAVIGKSGYEKWKVNEPGVFYFLFYVQSREIPKKPVAGVARKESRVNIHVQNKQMHKKHKNQLLLPQAR